jgi:hypothetical protein
MSAAPAETEDPVAEVLVIHNQLSAVLVIITPVQVNRDFLEVIIPAQMQQVERAVVAEALVV